MGNCANCPQKQISDKKDLLKAAHITQHDILVGVRRSINVFGHMFSCISSPISLLCFNVLFIYFDRNGGLNLTSCIVLGHLIFEIDATTFGLGSRWSRLNWALLFPNLLTVSSLNYSTGLK